MTDEKLNIPDIEPATLKVTIYRGIHDLVAKGIPLMLTTAIVWAGAPIGLVPAAQSYPLYRQIPGYTKETLWQSN